MWYKIIFIKLETQCIITAFVYFFAKSLLSLIVLCVSAISWKFYQNLSFYVAETNKDISIPSKSGPEMKFIMYENRNDYIKII